MSAPVDGLPRRSRAAGVAFDADPVDNFVAGNVSHAVVEFAPYQKTPPVEVKPDPRQNTIEDGE